MNEQKKIRYRIFKPVYLDILNLGQDMPTNDWFESRLHNQINLGVQPAFKVLTEV